MRRFYAFLFLAGLLVSLFAASQQHLPGYMDAEYYYAGALRIVDGQGWNEPYLWNYLSDPVALPAHAFAYWMPFSSLLAAAGLRLTPTAGFWGARVGFIMLAALVPPLTTLLAYRLVRRAHLAQLAGMLALFPGFYLAYQTTTDAFPIMMVLGGLFVLIAFKGSWPWLDRRPPQVRLFGLGLLAGLLHLARADGLLWLAGALVVALTGWLRLRTDDSLCSPSQRATVGWLLRGAGFGLAVLLGYLLVMWPWYARNLGVWGSPFPPGGSRALWINAYEQTMRFPAALLTPKNWISSGWGAILLARWQALSGNLQSLLAVQGGIVLLPFMLAGLWKLRDCPPVRLGLGMWLLNLGLMTLIFPYAGINGGFFHSGAALQPLLWALAPVGIETLMHSYARWRRIARPEHIVRFMSALLVVIGALLSFLLFYQRMGGSGAGEMGWNAGQQHYQAVEKRLVALGAEPGSPVLVNNPPSYWLTTHRPAVIIADGDAAMQLEVARQYGARFLVLEEHNPPALWELYLGEVKPPHFEYLDQVGSTQLYRLRLEP